MRRSGNATLPSAYLLNYGIRRTLKTNVSTGLAFAPLTVCKVDVSPKHKISYVTQHILNDRSHVLYLPTQKRFQAIQDGRYEERPDGLKIGFVVNTLQKRRVVRSWARRRIDQAVTEALRVRGFDKKGRRLKDCHVSIAKVSGSNSSLTDLTSKSMLEALIGTVNVQILPSSTETKFTEVQRQAGVVADKVLQTCGRYPRHNSTVKSGFPHHET